MEINPLLSKKKTKADSSGTVKKSRAIQIKTSPPSLRSASLEIEKCFWVSLTVELHTKFYSVENWLVKVSSKMTINAVLRLYYYYPKNKIENEQYL